MLVHTVLFWLKPGLGPDSRAEFERQLARLGQIPAVQAFYWGRPADTAPRPVIDRSYDYAITVIVRDVEGHDRYQEDPIHQDFVKRCGPWFDRVQVFDAS